MSRTDAMVREALETANASVSPARSVPVPTDVPALLRAVGRKTAAILSPEPTVNDVLALF